MGCSHSDMLISDLKQENPIYYEKYKDNQNFPLSDDEKHKIQMIWKKIGDEKELGISIMIRIFTVHKEIRNRWIFAVNLNTDEEMRNNSQLTYHAHQIIRLFSEIISRLNTPNPYDLKELIKLGTSHHGYGVQPSDFEHFEESLFYCMESKLSNPRLFDSDMKSIWRKFFWSVAGKMCEGIRKTSINELQDKQYEPKKFNSLF